MKQKILKELETIPYFLEKWYKFVLENPNKVILVDGADGNSMTVSMVEKISGCIYSYLKSQNVGKDDIVMVCMPRSGKVVATMIGIWKTGAALTLVEDDYPLERIAYIKKDTSCKLFINNELYEQIIKGQYEEGYKEAGLNDAAFVVYTSGSTGYPKGIIHEYGNIKLDSMFSGSNRVSFNTRYALNSPLNFVASIKIILAMINTGCIIYILPDEIIKNPLKLKEFFQVNKINVAFLSPSIIRVIGGELGSSMKFVFTGSEPANGIYVEGIHLINNYSMSESAFTVTQFEIDKPYDICPVGKPNNKAISILILDDEGKELPNGEIGEIAFENPFMRGYINLPEETKKALRDGLYHTGDIGKKLDDGNLVLLGRANEMIKINGNRIEPEEIEKQIKKNLGLTQCVVKGFEDASHSYICAYYTDDISFDEKEVQESLKKYLPYYMIPSYFIHIDKFPVLENGKIDKKALQSPNKENYYSVYSAPKTEIEKQICDAMAKVLRYDRIGVKDDFYQIGGDSVKTMLLLAEINRDNMSAIDILEGRTPERIAERITKNIFLQSIEDLELEARKKPHKLTPSQQMIFNRQELFPGNRICELPNQFKMEHPEEVEKIRDAINKVLKENDVFSTVITRNENGEIVQYFDPAICKTVEIQNVTEEEFQSILSDYLRHSIKILDNKLYKIDIYRTETNAYILMDMHHIIIDGSAYFLFFNKIRDAYKGIPSQMDTYYACLQIEEEKYNTDFYKEAQKYFDDNFGNVKWSKGITPDLKDGAFGIGEIIEYNVDINTERLTLFEKKSGFSRNCLFIVAILLAQAKIDKKNNIPLNWIFHYRMDQLHQRGLGILAKFLPIGLQIDKQHTLKDIFNTVKDQLIVGMKYSINDWVVSNEKNIEEDTVLYTYENMDITNNEPLIEMGLSRMAFRYNYTASFKRAWVAIVEFSNGIIINVRYLSKLYSKEKMQSFYTIFKNIVNKLLEEEDYDKCLVKDILNY